VECYYPNWVGVQHAPVPFRARGQPLPIPVSVIDIGLDPGPLRRGFSDGVRTFGPTRHDDEALPVLLPESEHSLYNRVYIVPIPIPDYENSDERFF